MTNDSTGLSNFLYFLFALFCLITVPTLIWCLCGIYNTKREIKNYRCNPFSEPPKPKSLDRLTVIARYKRMRPMAKPKE